MIKISKSRMLAAAGQAGISMIEVIVCLAIFAIVAGTAVSNLRELNDPLSNASFSVSHYLRLARSRAISQTQAIQITASSNKKLIAKRADTCSDTMTAVSDLTLDMPTGSQLVTTDWTVCFSARGFCPEHVQFDIRGDNSKTKTVEIALGGGVQIQ